ncbi:MAG: peroxidase-related enzyme [Acidobacteria bacterium]|nr:peroxidase-related enzyme [Acidobacteriota bacterium]
MPFVDSVPPEKAGPKLKAIYDELQNEAGFVPQFYQGLGLKPEVVRPLIGIDHPIMADAALPRKIKEQIAVVISGLNTSSYCVAMHLEKLKSFGIEKTLGRKLATNYPAAAVDDNVKALFRLAEKLTQHPENYSKQDVDEVLKAGWSQEAVLETVLAVSLFNMYNRISIGLGLIPEF